MLTLEVEKFENMNFMKPMRAIFSGSSQSGKTRLMGKILKNQNQLFGEKFELVKYFYPEYLEECPVDWHNEICTPISYQPGFPVKNDILSMPSNSLLIIDDNMAKVVKSELIRQLYNVISGKKNISVICVTQNYFTQGIYSRDIRNSSNYVALFRNCADASLNKRVATAFGLGKAYQKAEEEFFKGNVYPYVFIDQTQRAQLSSYRLYVNIFDNPRIAYSSSGMKGYILGEKEFNAAFKILQERKNNSTVVLNEDKTNKLSGTKRPAKGGQTKFKSSKSPGSARRDTTQKWRKFQPKSE
jgi:hypothetical protein